MARQNIDDPYWGDARRGHLIGALGSLWAADGVIVNAWRLAAQFWIPQKKDDPEKQLIPLDRWNAEKYPQAIVDVGLAEVRADGVYVWGTEERNAWWFEKRSGGKTSAANRKKKNGNARPNSKRVRTKLEHSSSTAEQTSNTPEQKGGVFEVTRSSSSSSSSSLNLKSLNSPISSSGAELEQSARENASSDSGPSAPSGSPPPSASAEALASGSSFDFDPDFDSDSASYIPGLSPSDSSASGARAGDPAGEGSRATQSEIAAPERASEASCENPADIPSEILAANRRLHALRALPENRIQILGLRTGDPSASSGLGRLDFSAAPGGLR